MRIIVMGTGPFAVPSFQQILESEHEVITLVNMPLRFDQRQRPIKTPMRLAAEHGNIPIFDPPSINSPESVAFLKKHPADVFFVCDYGQILSQEVLRIPKLGGINLHGSILPKYRGAAPINRAILNGDHTTGVSVIHMTAKVDAGPVVAQCPPIPIYPHETAVEAEKRLAEIGAWMVLRVLTQLEKGSIRAIPQMPHLVSKAPKLKKTDGLVPWYRSAFQIVDHYRAMQPWPRSFTYWHRADGTAPPMLLLLGPYEIPQRPIDPNTANREERRGRDRSPERKRRMTENYDFEMACEMLVQTTSIQDIANEMINAGLMTENELIFKPKVDRRGSAAPPPEVIEANPNLPKPGTVLEAEDDRLIVATGNGPLRILSIQPAGKKAMSSEAFMRGYPIRTGDRFGNI